MRYVGNEPTVAVDAIGLQQTYGPQRRPYPEYPRQPSERPVTGHGIGAWADGSAGYINPDIDPDVLRQLQQAPDGNRLIDPNGLRRLEQGRIFVDQQRPTSDRDAVKGVDPRLSGLGDSLKGLLGRNPSAAEIREAEDIGAAISRTWDKNGPPRWMWAPWAAVKNGIYALTGGFFGGEERQCNYYCYEWAYGFKNAFNLVHPKEFTVTVEYATHWKDDDEVLLHYWIRITSKRTGKSLYVDDGFFNGDFVHASRPNPYTYPPKGAGVREERCQPPTAVGPRPRAGGSRRPSTFDERAEEFQRITGESILGDSPRW